MRDQLENHPKYAPEAGLTEACFEEFIPFEEDKIRTIIGSMPLKSCELDPIPTQVIQEIFTSPTSNNNSYSQHIT